MDKEQIIEQIKQTVDVHRSLHLNDPAIENCWAFYENTLGKSLPTTLWVLENIEPYCLNYISESFAEISRQLQSTEFIACIRRLSKLHPEAKMDEDIVSAERVLDK